MFLIDFWGVLSYLGMFVYFLLLHSYKKVFEQIEIYLVLKKCLFEGIVDLHFNIKG